MAEDAGFEPARGCPLHAFQACALGHYANPPPARVPAVPIRVRDPPRGAIPRTPPGPEGSKGKRALVGARGVPSVRSVALPRSGWGRRSRPSDTAVRVGGCRSPCTAATGPETFAEVIGQDHVTDPLQQALRNDRVNHAYLFSGPRGCGKTTSARILARGLNCEQGPTPEPCGVCDSCVDLARGGPGSLDVIEIDAASHGGVDDARDLRERAFFAPAAARYKIYIIDEAHMVTHAGLQRPAQARRGAAAAPEVHLRDDRAGARSSARSARAPTTTRSGWCRRGVLQDYLRQAVRGRGRPGRPGRAAAGRARRRRLGARLAVGARPADRRRRTRGRHVRVRRRPARLHRRRAARRRRRRASPRPTRRSVFELVDRVVESGHRPAPVRRGPARAAARPGRAAGGARTPPPRGWCTRPAGPARPDAGPGGQVRRGRPGARRRTSSASG